MSIETGVFLYPWDAREEGPEHAMRRIRRDIGMDRVALNVSYHSGRFLHPRHRTGTSDPWFRGIINHRTAALTSFEPNHELYGSIKPIAEDALTRDDIAGRSVKAARDEGLGVDLWIVTLHNSTLGLQHPDRCVTNAFGDAYRYGLCPADPEVRRYAVALVEDACQRYQPDAVLLESLTYLGFIHGDHHELIMETVDDVTRWLLSMCFHPATQALAERAGVDADQVRNDVVGLCTSFLDQGRGAIDAAFRIAEPASLLLEFPHIHAYLRVMQDAVTSLVGEVTATAARHGATVRASASIFERPASRAWAEGTSLRDVADAADELAVVSYHPSARLVEADLQWVRAMIGERPMHVALNGGHPDAMSSRDMVDKAHVAAAMGATGISIYNYGLLNERRLGWLRDVNASLGKEVGSA